MSPVLFDASALLAMVLDEPGAHLVASHLASGQIGAPNYSEVLVKLLDLGYPLAEAQAHFASLELPVVAFDQHLAEVAAGLRRPTRGLGLSFADRACLALALALRVPVLTADRIWAQLDLGVEVRLIR